MPESKDLVKMSTRMVKVGAAQGNGGRIKETVLFTKTGCLGWNPEKKMGLGFPFAPPDHGGVGGWCVQEC